MVLSWAAVDELSSQHTLAAFRVGSTQALITIFLGHDRHIRVSRSNGGCGGGDTGDDCDVYTTHTVMTFRLIQSGRSRKVAAHSNSEKVTHIRLGVLGKQFSFRSLSLVFQRVKPVFKSQTRRTSSVRRWGKNVP